MKQSKELPRRRKPRVFFNVCEGERKLLADLKINFIITRAVFSILRKGLQSLLTKSSGMTLLARVSIQGNLCFLQSSLKFLLSNWFSLKSVSQFRTKLPVIKVVEGFLALSKSRLKSLNFPVFGENIVQSAFLPVGTRKQLCFDVCRIHESITIQKQHVMFHWMVSYGAVTFGWQNDTVLWALSPRRARLAWC